MAEPLGLGPLSPYPEAWVVFLGVGAAALVAMGLLYALAQRHRLLPAIRSRDVHTTRKPRVGGVAMWLVAVVALVVIATGNHSGLLTFAPGVLQGVFAGLAVVLLFGLLDDLYGLPAFWQLLGQVVAGASLVMGGLQIESLRLPFIGVLSLHPAWSAVLVVAWIVVMINAVNLFDGLDGLAGSLSLTAAVILFLVSLKLGFIGAATLCLILIGITAGFLPWNWHPSKLFMGTVGSQLLGFLLATIAVISGAKVATAVLVLGIPLFDAFSVIVRRLLAGQSPFHADQRHLHHRLLKIGLTPPYVVLVTNIMAVLFGVFALTTQQANEKALLILCLILSMFAFIGLTYLLERKSVRG
ncbi:MAG TPA: MraY family glycosyltransferase [Verrucomicrobiae bacterium]|nr:MraY family glycosyltransferase [Verrucomicrobiae bacterium]